MVPCGNLFRLARGRHHATKSKMLWDLGSDQFTYHMKGVGVEIHLARVKYEVMELLEKDGADKNIGRDLIHNKVFEAVQWFTQKD